jgi:nucleoside phosphorylase
MFEEPAKKDIDAALSLLMHEARRFTLDQKNLITSNAIKAGALGGNRLILSIANEADKAHSASIDSAKKILVDFIVKLQIPAIQVITWARPHLENLSNSILGVIPPNGLPNDHNRATQQYSAIFKQRIELALREVEIGYVKGVGFLQSNEQRILEASKVKRSAVILTALHIETRAVLRHLAEIGEETERGTIFHVGRFAGWHVAVAECGEGNVYAGVTVERAIARFKPDVALFVGVAGGLKDVLIGDALVSSKVYGYERGKDTSEGFRPRPAVELSAYALEQRAKTMKLRDDWQKRLDPKLKHTKPTIYVGPIATGEKVVSSSSGAIAEYLRQNYGDALGVEMEGQGFLAGVRINDAVQGCVVRGISDLLDGKAEADKAGSQERAADVASAVAYEMLATLGAAMAERSVPAEGLEQSADRRIESAQREDPFPEAKALDGPGRFRAPGEAIGSLWDVSLTGHESGASIYLTAGPTTWLRLRPTSNPKITWTAQELRAASRVGAILQPFVFSSLFTLRAADGIGTCNLLTRDDTETNSVVFAFETGELWAIDTWLLGTQPSIIPVTQLERSWTLRLQDYGQFLARLSLPGPYRWVAGLSAVRHRRLQFPPKPGSNWYPDWKGPECLTDDIVADGTYADAQSPISALLPFFDLVYRKCGIPRPEYLPR